MPFGYPLKQPAQEYPQKTMRPSVSCRRAQVLKMVDQLLMWSLDQLGFLVAQAVKGKGGKKMVQSHV